jgi:hypothetical protein
MSRNRLGVKSHARRSNLVHSRLAAASRHWARMMGNSEVILLVGGTWVRATDMPRGPEVRFEVIRTYELRFLR